MNALVGTDAEIFLKNAKGKHIASVGLFGGTKLEPLPFGTVPGFAVQEDNVALEFNIPPAKTQEEFSKFIQIALDECTERAKKHGLIIDIAASAVFKPDQLQSMQAKVFGCEPDFDVWKMQDNPPPACKNKQLRTAAAHIHIGAQLDFIALGRACDLFLGAPSIVLDPDQRRRQLYGRAGAVRRKPYGVEYRTLSNFWLTKHRDWVYNQVQNAVKFVKEGNYLPEGDAKKLISCINNFDLDLLRDLTKTYKLQY